MDHLLRVTTIFPNFNTAWLSLYIGSKLYHTCVYCRTMCHTRYIYEVLQQRNGIHAQTLC